MLATQHPKPRYIDDSPSGLVPYEVASSGRVNLWDISSSLLGSKKKLSRQFLETCRPRAGGRWPIHSCGKPTVFPDISGFWSQKAGRLVGTGLAPQPPGPEMGRLSESPRKFPYLPEGWRLDISPEPRRARRTRQLPGSVNLHFLQAENARFGSEADIRSMVFQRWIASATCSVRYRHTRIGNRSA